MLRALRGRGGNETEKGRRPTEGLPSSGVITVNNWGSILLRASELSHMGKQRWGICTNNFLELRPVLQVGIIFGNLIIAVVGTGRCRRIARRNGYLPAQDTWESPGGTQETHTTNHSW